MPNHCFLIVPQHLAKVYFRRYREADCPIHDIHSAIRFWKTVPTKRIKDNKHREIELPVSSIVSPPRYDPRWPDQCACRYQFASHDPRHLVVDQVYADAWGNTYSLREPTPGMMWNAWWMLDKQKVNGAYLCVVLPDKSVWYIDGKSPNCPHPAQWPGHRCWERYGEPPHVSVVAGDHGDGSVEGVSGKSWFLRDGEFVWAS